MCILQPYTSLVPPSSVQFDLVTQLSLDPTGSGAEVITFSQVPVPSGKLLGDTLLAVLAKSQRIL